MTSVGACRRAGLDALARGDHREAAARLDEALRGLGEPPERASVEIAVDLRLDLRAALLPLGEERRVLGLLREAEALAGAIDDAGRLGRVVDALAFHHWLRGEPADAAREGRRALALAETAGDATLAIVAGHHLGLAAYSTGEYAAGIAAFRRTIAALTGELAHARLGLVNPPAITSRTYLAWCLAEVGDFDEATAVAETALGIAESLGPTLGVLAAGRGLASVLVRRGDVGRARALLERMLPVCRAGGVQLYLASFTSYLGYAHALSDDPTSALPLLQEAVGLTAITPVLAEQALRLTWLGDALLMAGRIDEARAHAADALALAGAHGERGAEAWALRLHGAVWERRGDAARARTGYGAALARASVLGMRPLIGHAHLGLSRVTAGETAHDHRVTALATYRALGMRMWGPGAAEMVR